MPISSRSTRLLPAREATFRLSAEDRAGLAAWRDTDALEEVLAWLEPEYRSEVLDAMRDLATAKAASVRIRLLSENDPEWLAAPEALKSAVRRFQEVPHGLER